MASVLRALDCAREVEGKDPGAAGPDRPDRSSVPVPCHVSRSSGLGARRPGCGGKADCDRSARRDPFGDPLAEIRPAAAAGRRANPKWGASVRQRADGTTQRFFKRVRMGRRGHSIGPGPEDHDIERSRMPALRQPAPADGRAPKTLRAVSEGPGDHHRHDQDQRERRHLVQDPPGALAARPLVAREALQRQRQVMM